MGLNDDDFILLLSTEYTVSVSGISVFLENKQFSSRNRSSNVSCVSGINKEY